MSPNRETACIQTQRETGGLIATRIETILSQIASLDVHLLSLDS